MRSASLDPFHDGERVIQERTGERAVALAHGRNVTDRIPGRAKAFIAQQQYGLLGWSDPAGALWASFLAGPQGFARADSAGELLEMALHDDANVLSDIPPFHALRTGDFLGVLFADLATRRRLRVNGRVADIDASGLRIAVDYAYPNCPKYIRRREIAVDVPQHQVGSVERGSGLTDATAAWIAGSDTFFVASAHPNGPADVSHRGGRPGFVRVDGNVLTIPDYPGNSMFNTFGNFALNPRAGLVFVDFDANCQLQLTGTVRLDFATEAADKATGGTGRWWEFHAEQWLVSPLNHALAWQSMDESPFNP